MSKPTERNRREFARYVALGAATLGSLPVRTVAADGGAPRAKRKTKVRIGTRIKPDWLKSKNDQDLRFLKQIGVDFVNVQLEMVKGYQETGIFTKADLNQLIDRLDSVGLKIERANASGGYHYVNALIGLPGGQPEIDKLRRVAELVAEAEIPVFSIQPMIPSRAAVLGRERWGWSRKQGRGGYGKRFFDLNQVESISHVPKIQTTTDQLWKALLNIYRQVIPAVEGSKTKIAMHGNDPPLSRIYGNPQILYRFADFDRLFAEVPSRHNGMLFCVGTRYESGEDIFKGIRHFGRQGKLLQVHFRNVRGTLPVDRGYSETFVDDGDMDMFKVLRALDEVGYDGVIDYDHPMDITGDGPVPKQYVAFAVGYMRGLIDSLPG